MLVEKGSVMSLVSHTAPHPLLLSIYTTGFIPCEPYHHFRTSSAGERIQSAPSRVDPNLHVECGGGEPPVQPFIGIPESHH